MQFLAAKAIYSDAFFMDELRRLILVNIDKARCF